MELETTQFLKVAEVKSNRKVIIPGVIILFITHGEDVRGPVHRRDTKTMQNKSDGSASASGLWDRKHIQSNIHGKYNVTKAFIFAA